MNQDEHRNSPKGIPGRLFVALFQQCCVLVKLDGGACDFIIDVAQLSDELFLVPTLPDISLRINLKQVPPRFADEPITKRSGEIFDSQGRAIVLVPQRLKSLANILKQ